MAEFNLATWNAHWESETAGLREYIDSCKLEGSMIESVAFLGQMFNIHEFTELDENVNGRWAMVNEPIIFKLASDDKSRDLEILFNSICGISFDEIAPDTTSKYTDEERNLFASTVFNPIIGLKIDKIHILPYTDPMRVNNPEIIKITFANSQYYLELSGNQGAYTQMFLKDETNETVKL